MCNDLSKSIYCIIYFTSLVCLTDLFAIATAVSGDCETRDGNNIIGMLDGTVLPRDFLFACYGRPGTPLFKFMVRFGEYKYIFISNGNRRQLFNLKNDPNELNNLADIEVEKLNELHETAHGYAYRQGLYQAFDGDNFKIYPYTQRPFERINQMSYDLGVTDFTVN